MQGVFGPRKRPLGLVQDVSSGDFAPSWLARLSPLPSRFCATKSQLTMLESTALANRGRSLR